MIPAETILDCKFSYKISYNDLCTEAMAFKGKTGDCPLQ